MLGISKQPANASSVENNDVGSTRFKKYRQSSSLRWWATVAIVIAASGLLIASDYRRTVADNLQQLQISARYLAAELNGSDQSTLPTVLGFLVRQIPKNSKIFMVEPGGGLIASTGEVDIGNAVFSAAERLKGSFWAETMISAKAGSAIVALDRNIALRGFYQRSVIGLTIALALLLLSWRHNNSPPSEPATQNTPDLIRLIDTLPLGVACWSAQGKLVACNAQYRTRLGLSSEDTEPGSAYVKTMDKVHAENGYRLLSDEDLIRRAEIQQDDGSSILIDERPFMSDGFISLVTDNSEQMAAEQQLMKIRDTQRSLSQQLHAEKIKAESASRSKTSFLAHLSHDVRTPLNHIIGFADLIAHQTYGEIGDKRYLDYISDIKASGEKLLASFSEILELAQLEGGHLVLRRESFSIADIAATILERYQDNADRAGIKLHVTAPDDALMFADRFCIERMLGNLIENSIRFTPTGGRVKLAAWKGKDGLVLEISDTGIGMSPERLSDLSHPFVLGDAAFTREGGVGLGIAISRAIAELSGGELAIDSSPAVGTTVAISLPLDPAQGARKTRAA